MCVYWTCWQGYFEDRLYSRICTCVIYVHLCVSDNQCICIYVLWCVCIFVCVLCLIMHAHVCACCGVFCSYICACVIYVYLCVSDNTRLCIYIVCFVCIFVRVSYMYICVRLIMHVYVHICCSVPYLYICTRVIYVYVGANNHIGICIYVLWCVLFVYLFVCHICIFVCA